MHACKLAKSAGVGGGGGGGTPGRDGYQTIKLLRMSWNTFWFGIVGNPKKSKNLQRCPPNFFLKNTNVTNTGFLPFVLIVSQNNVYREGCKQEWIKIDQIVLF